MKRTTYSCFYFLVVLVMAACTSPQKKEGKEDEKAINFHIKSFPFKHLDYAFEPMKSGKAGHVKCTLTVGEGKLKEIYEHGDFTFKSYDPFVTINKIGAYEFEFFIDSSYAEDHVSFEVGLVPKKNVFITTYYNRVRTTHPDTLHLLDRNVSTADLKNLN